MKLPVLISIAFVLIAYSASQQIIDSFDNLQWINPFPWRLSSYLNYHPFSLAYSNLIKYPYNHNKEIIQTGYQSLVIERDDQSSEGYGKTESQRVLPQQRFFLNIFNPYGGNNGFPGLFLRPMVTSTITTAVVSSCIPQNQFASANAAGPFSYSKSCLAKKRSSSLEEQLAGEFDFFSPAVPLSILPSNVDNVQPTSLAVPKLDEDVRMDRSSAVLSSEQELKSSKEETPDDDGAAGDLSRKPRRFQARYLLMPFKTQYVFTSTLIWKTVKLAAVNGRLTCLPDGFKTCSA